jgi:hypothetical protein
MKFIDTIKSWLIFQYNSIWNYFHFRYMRNIADKMHAKTGKRYHVVPKTKTSLMVVDNTYVDKYNKLVKGKAKKITIIELCKMSYYSTSVQGITRK